MIPPSTRDLTLVQIRRMLSGRGPEQVPLLLEAFRGDHRRTARDMALSLEARWRQWLSAERHQRPRWERESAIRCRGTVLVAGVDEVGRGPLAGPVVAAAVIFPPGIWLPGLNDSKLLSGRFRRQMFRKIRARALALGTGVVGPRIIERIGINRASLLAMKRAVTALDLLPGRVLVDGQHTIPGLDIPQRAWVQGDSLLASVAGASVVAKVYRDALMARYSMIYPGYGFLKNRGYGTKAHLAALERMGPCPLHRASFLRDEISSPGRAVPGQSFLEDVAVREVERVGFTVLKRGFRCRWGRIALVARDGEQAVLVEVRAGPDPTLTPVRRIRLLRMAAAWACAKGASPAGVRVDLVSVIVPAGSSPRTVHCRDILSPGHAT